MKKKRLVHVITSLKRGGAESLLVDFVGALSGYEHHVIYFYDGPNRKRIEDQGIVTYHIRGLFFIYDLLFCMRFFFLLKRLKPDLIHTSLWSANFLGRIAARFLRIPFISIVHLGVDLDGSMRNCIDRCSFFLSDVVVAVSQEVACSIASKQFIPAKQITVISNGINSAALKAEAYRLHIKRSDVGIDANQLVIGSVGRFIARKNYALLLQAFCQAVRKVHNAHLVLIGFGPEEKALRILAERLGIAESVTFVVGQAAHGYFPLFDCFVLPSKQEGMSIALLEAMCFGLPCIVTSTNLKHEVITHEHDGLIVPADDMQILSEVLHRLLIDPSLQRKLGAQAYKNVQDHFSIERMAQEYQKLFDKISC